MRQATTCLALLQVSCSGDHGRGKDALEVLVPTPPATLDPRFATDAVAIRVTRLVHAGLVGLDETTLAPRPYVARSWTWEGTSALRVTLRDEVRFASGAPLGPEDVCATLAALADPSLGSPHRAVASSIDRCEILSPTELRVVLREPRATLLTDLEVPVLRRDQARLPPGDGASLDGLGPYAIASFDGETVQLRARDAGALPRPKHDVAVRVVRDENARAVRVLTGPANVVPNAISPVLLDALVREGAHVSSTPGANLTYLLVHHGRSPWSDASARQGVAEAIDRPLLARTLLGGRALVADSFLPPSSWAYAAPEHPLVFDPADAHARLARAGATTVTLLTSTDRARVTMARAIAQMLGDVGLHVEVVPLDFGVLLARLNAGDYELSLLQFPELTEPNVLKWFFHSAGIPRAGGQPGANRARYQSATVDRLLDLASRDNDLQQRRDLYRDALAAMLTDLAVIPLFHEDEIAVTTPRAASLRLSAEGRWLGIAAIP